MQAVNDVPRCFTAESLPLATMGVFETDEFKNARIEEEHI